MSVPPHHPAVKSTPANPATTGEATVDILRMVNPTFMELIHQLLAEINVALNIIAALPLAPPIR